MPLKVVGNSIRSLSKEVDVLISHGTCLDIAQIVRPKLHLWGHHHSCFGVTSHAGAVSVCATAMDGKYKLRHTPIVIDVPTRNFTHIRREEENQHNDVKAASKEPKKSMFTFPMMSPFKNRRKVYAGTAVEVAD
jgi:hypothetical protein